MNRENRLKCKARQRSIAEQLIEEFMLAANETVAEHFFRLEVPFIYRIHESPDVEKLRAFFEFVTSFGYTIKGRPGADETTVTARPT